MAKKPKAKVVVVDRTASAEEKAAEMERKKRTEKLVDPQPASVPLERPEEVKHLAEELESMAAEEKPASESSDDPSKKDTEEDQDEERNPPPPSSASGGKKKRRPPTEDSEEDPYVDPVERKKTMGKLWKALIEAINGHETEARKVFVEVAEELGSSALFRLPIWNTLLGELIGAGISIGGVSVLELWKRWKKGERKGVIEPEYEIKSEPPSSPAQPGPS